MAYDAALAGNTSPFDHTHYPAMAIYRGMSDGLPVSMMLIGKHFDEPTIYRAAFAFEKSATGRSGHRLGLKAKRPHMT